MNPPNAPFQAGFPRPDYAALTRYAPDRRPVPVDLSDNTNLWGAHPAALDALRTVESDALARYPVLYADALREAAAARFGVRPDQVTTGCGSDDVLDSVWRAVAEFGGTVAWPGPTFSMVEPFTRMNGRESLELPWAEVFDDPARLLQDDPVLVYVCRPNNPTGHSTAASWVDALLEAVGDDGPVVVLDEAYADFAGETLIERAVEHPRALAVRTLSKAFGLAGLRVGLGFGSEALIMEVEKSRGPYKVSRVAESAAVAALRDEAGWVERTVAECVENRDRLQDALVDAGWAPMLSHANFIFVPLAPEGARTVSDRLRREGVAVRPFEATSGLAGGIRVTVGPWALMERFLDVLGRA